MVPTPLTYIDIPCPSGKHQQSIVTFRNYTVAGLFCEECETAWWVPITAHPELHAVSLTLMTRDTNSKGKF